MQLLRYVSACSVARKNILYELHIVQCYKELPDVNKGKGRGGNVCLPLKGCGSCKASQKVSSGHLGSLLFNLRSSVAGLVLFDWL